MQTIEASLAQKTASAVTMLFIHSTELVVANWSTYLCNWQIIGAVEGINWLKRGLKFRYLIGVLSKMHLPMSWKLHNSNPGQ